MKYRDLIDLLVDDGWQHVRTSGSHRVYQHPDKPGIVVVPVHSPGHDVPKGLLFAIMKQSGDQPMTSSYLVIYERADDGTVSAYVPELQPGVVISTGRNHEEARTMISEAIALYLEEMRRSGQAISASPVRYEVLEVAS